MKNKNTLILSVIVCLLPMILGITLYNKLPEQMPIHFTINDIPDNYAPKNFVLFGIPIIMAIVQAICIIFTTKKVKNNEKPKNSEDYFKAPDLMGIDLPGEVPTYNTNNVPLASNIDTKSIETESKQNSLENAINIINNSIKEIEQSGIKVEKDEMNLNNSYQVIIKLEKDN